MKKMIKAAIVATAISAITACGGDLGSDKHYREFTVIEHGNCRGGEGTFDGPYKCAVRVKSESGKVLYGYAYGDVWNDQTVYRECWVDDGQAECFATFKLDVRSMYLDGGKRS